MTICVPAEDDAVQRAFERLDAQMDAWLAAMKRLDAHLKINHGTSPAPTVASVEPPKSELPANVAQVTQPEPSALQPAEKTAPVPRPAIVTPVEVTAAPGKSVAVPVGLMAVPGEQTSPPAQTAQEKQGELDGEALLATLDEETAKAIRVMRRLSFGQRTVRDLLAEYRSKQANRPAEETSCKPKSWWRRGK